jgi:hypothetical protein
MMSTIELRASRATHPSLLLRGLARIGSAICIVFEVMDEALSQADAARRRYPFTAW